MTEYEKKIIKVFESTTNSYKYYWWYAILQFVKKKKNQIYNLDEIAIQMIVLAWYPVNYYKLSLGKQDQLAAYIKVLKNEFSDLKEDIKEEDLFLFLNDNKNQKVVKGIMKKLTKYVPYRFIRPWFDESIGIDDAKVNSLVISLQNSQDKNLPYKINLETNQIQLESNWLGWIYSNIRIIESFTLYELFKYVEKNNPYVTNISLKLFKPQTRKYYKLYLDFLISRILTISKLITAKKNMSTNLID